jgi:hypothetical protein
MPAKPLPITSASSGTNLERDLSSRTVAELLDCRPGYIDKLCEKGILGGYKMSDTPKGKWRIPESEVEAYRNRQKEAARQRRPLSLVEKFDKATNRQARQSKHSRSRARNIHLSSVENERVSPAQQQAIEIGPDVHSKTTVGLE